jgi:hypothetical protein
MRLKGLSLIFLTLIMLASRFVSGQVDTVSNNKVVKDCEATLAVATGEFHAGRFFSLPSILKGCLDRGFTNEQKIRAYILLCQVYLINDNPSEAEASYLKLLKVNPEYIATPEIDPIDVVFLSKKFTTRPVFTPHVKFGVNATTQSIVHNVQIHSEKDSIQSRLRLKPGISIGAGLDWNVSDRISLAGDLVFTARRFSKTVNKIYGLDQSDQTATLYWIDLPVYLKYQDYEGKFRPFGYLGYSLHFNLLANAEFSYINKESPTTDTGSGTESPTQGTAVNFTHRQYLLNQSLVLGGGIKYKIKKNYVFADLRLQVGLTNVTKSDKIFYDAGGSFDINTPRYNVVHDMYRVNGLMLSVGYIFPVYNPRKKGGWQPKGLLGKILYGNTSTIEEGR